MSVILVWSLNDVAWTHDNERRFPKSFDDNFQKLISVFKTIRPVMVAVCGSSHLWVMPGFDMCADEVVRRYREHGILAIRITYQL